MTYCKECGVREAKKNKNLCNAFIRYNRKLKSLADRGMVKIGDPEIICARMEMEDITPPPVAEVRKAKFERNGNLYKWGHNNLLFVWSSAFGEWIRTSIEEQRRVTG